MKTEFNFLDGVYSTSYLGFFDSLVPSILAPMSLQKLGLQAEAAKLYQESILSQKGGWYHD